MDGPLRWVVLWEALERGSGYRFPCLFVVGRVFETLELKTQSYMST